MMLTLESASFADGDAISHIMAEAFYSTRLQQRLFPNVSLETKTENQRSRWPENYSAANVRHNKIVSGETGEMVSYANWEFVNVDATDVASDISDLPADSAMDSKRRSKGVDKAFADAVEKEMAHLQPDDLPAKPYMTLLGIGTLSKWQGFGAGGMHMRWAAKVADEKCIPIYIEAAQEATPFYTRHGYTILKSVQVDLGTEDPKPYIISSMMREPE